MKTVRVNIFMPSVYRPRRPRASPLWQVVHHCWSDFVDGHERLLVFTCKTRHFCPSCHQPKVRSTGDWIVRALCFEVPQRQFVFTMPKPLRGIFRRRRKLLNHLFSAAIDSLREWMRARLELPDGRLAAVAAVQTFGGKGTDEMKKEIPSSNF